MWIHVLPQRTDETRTDTSLAADAYGHADDSGFGGTGRAALVIRPKSGSQVLCRAVVGALKPVLQSRSRLETIVGRKRD